jgi:hypothetical protein
VVVLLDCGGGTVERLGRRWIGDLEDDVVAPEPAQPRDRARRFRCLQRREAIVAEVEVDRSEHIDASDEAIPRTGLSGVPILNLSSAFRRGDTTVPLARI